MTKYPEEQRPDLLDVFRSDLLDVFAKEIGPQAEVFIQHRGRSAKSSVDTPFDGWINPRGWSGQTRAIDARGHTWDEVYDLLRDRWALRAAQERAQTVTEMALAVIELTSKRGECNDSALRGRGFCTSDIEALGDEACKEARAMCDASMDVAFTIVRVGLPNAAAA